MNLRTNFLNWRPDQEAFGNDGLTVADNVIHDTEGYKELDLVTAGASGTTSGLSSICALRVHPMGEGGQTLKCWLKQKAGPVLSLQIGVNPVTTLDEVDSATVASLNAGAITSFTVAELEDAIFVCAEATVEKDTGGYSILNITGYSTFNF